MIKNFLLASTFALALVACDNQAPNADNKQEVAQTEVAAPESKITQLSLAEFPQKAEGLFEKEVEIKGIVDHVCAHGGRKMVLVQEGTENRVIVFAGDDMPAFSADWEGSEVKVDGKIVDKEFLEAMSTDTEDHHAGEGKGKGNGKGDGTGDGTGNGSAHNHDADNAAHDHDDDAHVHDADTASCDSEKAAAASQENNERMFFILANTAEEVPTAE